MLRRTRAGPFDENQAISLDKLTALGHSRALEQALLPLTAGLDDIPVLPLEPAQHVTSTISATGTPMEEAQ